MSLEGAAPVFQALDVILLRIELKQTPHLDVEWNHRGNNADNINREINLAEDSQSREKQNQKNLVEEKVVNHVQVELHLAVALEAEERWQKSLEKHYEEYVPQKRTVDDDSFSVTRRRRLQAAIVEAVKHLKD